KAAIEGADAILFVTPEYNRSIPGSLKNAIDWATRPWGKNSLNAKPVAVIGASPGLISTAVAQQHLKSILAFTNSPLLGQPEAYIQFTEGLINDDGEITREATTEFLTLFLEAFHGHIKRNLG
ncbi:MAG TPA: NADPH-dependent FMN reductase, partial [Pseudonocardia sp.]|nr:NADPH-dependent FMN reductase [Pseudonocardia sp.]